MFKVSFTVDDEVLKKYWTLSRNAVITEKEIEETYAQRSILEKSWVKKEKEVRKYFLKHVGIALEGNFTVYVVHPKLEVGEYLDEKNIVWGYDELYDGYTSVGIAHEILHCLTDHFYKNLSDDDKWIFHSLIFLLIDEMLRESLFYKEKNPILQTYHPRLRENAEKFKSCISENHNDIVRIFEKIKGANSAV